MRIVERTIMADSGAFNLKSQVDLGRKNSDLQID
jgi:hypothetical protein